MRFLQLTKMFGGKWAKLVQVCICICLYSYLYLYFPVSVFVFGGGEIFAVDKDVWWEVGKVGASLYLYLYLSVFVCICIFLYLFVFGGV